MRRLFPLAFSLSLSLCGVPAAAGAQITAEPVLRGRVLVADSAASTGTVVLHEITDLDQGELDSMSVGTDGSFSFRLPRVPDGSEDHFFFVSIRHAGILYFGAAVSDAAQLDSLYEIQAFDTLMAPSEGLPLPVQARNIFFEPDEGAWRVTDVFQVSNDRDRTVVARDGGKVWSYPLPRGARNFTSGQGELSLDGTSFEDGIVSVRAAIAPGERVFVMRYVLDDPFVTLPTPGTTDALDLLVREPAIEVAVEGLELVGRVEVEAGSTYRRYTGVGVTEGVVRLIEVRPPARLPVRWITVILTLVLAAAGLMAFRKADSTPAQRAPARSDRERLLLEVARLDERFHAHPSPSAAERTAYEQRRAGLIRRLRGHA